MRSSFGGKLFAATFALGVSLAPVTTHAVSICTTPGLSFAPVDKSTMTVVVDDDDLPTPPLTRPPSLERNDEGVVDVTETFVVLENVARGQEEQQSTEEHWLLRNLTAAIMLAARFLVGPPLRVRTRQGCRDGEDEDDESRTARSSLWRKIKATARKILDKTKETIRNVGDRFRGLFDRTIARTARLLALGKMFTVRDMPSNAGHKRHDSNELYERDRKRLGANETIAAGVKQICYHVARQYPEVGYNQGFDAACKAILECVGGNTQAALQLFPKWAVPVAWLTMNDYDEGKRAIEPAISYVWSIITMHAAPVFGWLSRDPIVGCSTADEMVETITGHIFFEPLVTFCSRLGLSKRVMDEIVEETIKVGVHGPAVTMFVVMSLLCLAEKQGAGRVEEVVMMKVPLQAAAKTVRSFKALQEHAPITLAEFLDGYRNVMAIIPGGAEL